METRGPIFPGNLGIPLGNGCPSLEISSKQCMHNQMQPKLQHLVIQVCCIRGLSHQVQRMYEFVPPQSNLIISVLPIFHLEVPDVPLFPGKWGPASL